MGETPLPDEEDVDPQEIIEEAQRLYGQGRMAEVETLVRKLLPLAPDDPELLNYVGLVCRHQRKFAEAEELFGKAVAVNPQSATYRLNYAETLRELRRLDEAVEAYRQALQLQPNIDRAHRGLATTYRMMQRLSDAVDQYRQAIGRDPNDSESVAGLALLLRTQGRSTEATPVLRLAYELTPTAERHSQFLAGLWYDPEVSPELIVAEHARFAERWAAPLVREITPHTNTREPGRRLRIGYVSPDLRFNVVGMFLRPILRCHDHREFEIFCYSDVGQPDFFTEWFKTNADAWLSVTGMSDADLASRIRADGIDILVDLNGHTPHNRILLFARKPAPVQASYLGFAGTTGLATIDYRFTDVHMDATGAESFGVERLVRLPETYWSYEPALEAPPVTSGPVTKSADGHVTFGCFATTSKVNPHVIELWSKILNRVPNARFRMVAMGGQYSNRNFGETFQKYGVDAGRVDVIDVVPYDKYFSMYDSIDIALDPFPYNGGTTTLDALFMGVPVVTLAGRFGMSRAGVSILRNTGLEEFIADGPERYVEIAAQLAGDLPRLAALRKELRDRVQRSPLTDAPRFTRHLESAYRDMWRAYCA